MTEDDKIGGIKDSGYSILFDSVKPSFPESL